VDDGSYREAAFEPFCPAVTGPIMKDNSEEETHSKRPIIAAAKDLFHQRGVPATHLDEIVQASGVVRREFNR
jgi:hypothetical protein